MEKRTLVNGFKKQFGDVEADEVYFAPGRVNLIGEHIDYNGGYVLPCAIQLGTYAVVRQRDDERVRLYSENFSHMGILEASLSQIAFSDALDWANYPLGIFHTLMGMGYALPKGFDMYFYGNLPNGAGLSSSASIEVLTATILNQVYNLGLSGVDVALISQKSENTFNGVNCGIMDQFSVAMGKENHAILLNCNTLEYRYIPASLGDYRLMIINSNKKRGLVESAYNERRQQCEDALQIVSPQTGAKHLCDIEPHIWQGLAPTLNDGAYKRAHHAVMEQYRTKKGAEALAEENLAAFGEWMYRSHDSLRYDFEVSCYELDTIVTACKTVRGVLGARMTGAGFGGCVVALVHKEKVPTLKEAVVKATELAGTPQPEFYEAQIGAGAGVYHESHH